MKKLIVTLAGFVLALAVVRLAIAAPDQYIGDTAIYSGATTTIRPNVLLIVDNSNATLNSASGQKYDPSIDYCAVHNSCTYNGYSIYQADQQGDFSASKPVVTNATSALENVACTNNNQIVKTTLLAAGTYVGSGTTNNPNLKAGTGSNNGKVVCDTAPKGATYALGNFLNYSKGPTGASGDSQRKVIYDAIETVVAGARYAVNFGALVYGSNNKGGNIVSQVGDLSVDTNFNAFLSTLPGGTPGTEVLSSQTARPQGEALLDAGYYFRGLALPVSGQAAMPSPITHTCDKNYIIMITNGLSNKDDDPKLATLVGDRDNDNAEQATYGLGTHYLDDVAKLLYESDNNSSISGVQRIVTHTILAFQADDPLVRRAADPGHGRGSYFNVSNANELAEALTKLISNIVLEADTSFVAPVVPASPENRTFSGNRIYMGFFKPITQKYWLGNLKKYGLDSANNLLDKNGGYATWADINGDGRDDRTGDLLPSGSQDGSFRSTAVSYWSIAADGEAVDKGGVGELLVDQATRNIYTYLGGANKSLTIADNLFATANAGLTSSLFTVTTDTEKDQIINFVRGQDPFDEDGNGNTTENRSWILGDILHSRPLVVNYASYTFNATNEADCSVNKTMIYVGANDGMLHAFKDCDGSEAWAFVPPDLIKYLKHLKDSTHSYYVDASPTAYVYDANKNGTIESGDKVIILFGERRGGGNAEAPTAGKYHAIDVSNPSSPVYLWGIGNDNASFAEMGESWSDPKIARMRIGTAKKIVAVVGAGYDNSNEDGRYGNTLTYSGNSSVTITATGYGNVTSTSGNAKVNPKGRGLYIIELATYNNSGVPDFTSSGTKIWGYTYGATATTSATAITDPNMTFSIPSDVEALDTDGDGYLDRIYVGDTGGNIWRFNVGDSSTSNWTGRKIFNLNTGGTTSSSIGKKIFFKPSVSMEGSYAMLLVGTGDREHPLNWGNYADRIYGLKDKGQTTVKSEGDLVDVTDDTLQQTSDSAVVDSTLTSLAATTKYGWFIRLNAFNTATGVTTGGNTGEKSLAAPLVFNKVVYFTTYAPSQSVSPDPCLPGNLGDGRLYAVDYQTGEAVLNYYKANDSTSTTNVRASNTSGVVKTRVDRSVSLGPGIPSGIVIMKQKGGELEAIVASEGKVVNPEIKKGGIVKTLFWRQK